MSEKFVITSCEYVISAVSPQQYPSVKLPEIVFIGRSNVGKSSLLNSLVNRRSLAKTSSTPGKTQTINFFKAEMKITTDRVEYKQFYLVDLPGYGYAKTSKKNRSIWSKFIEEYLQTSDQIKFICQLIDIRHEPMDSDLNMFQFLINNNLPVLTIATKMDKLSRLSRDIQVALIRKKFNIPELSVLPYSSVKHEGRSELLDTIYNSLLE